MAATIKELVTIVVLLYLAGCALMGIIIYILILVRVADYYMHLDEEDDEY